MVTACPEITIVRKDDDIDFVVLATDGIWDRMTNQQVSGAGLGQEEARTKTSTMFFRW